MLRRPAFMLLALSLVVAAGACGRSDPGRDAPGAAGLQGDGQQVSMPPLDAYRMLYCDTAIQGNTPALMCAYDIFHGNAQRLFRLPG